MKHPYTGTEHILLGLLREQESTAGQVLINAGVTEAGLTDMISQLIAPEGGMLPEEGRSFTPVSYTHLSCRAGRGIWKRPLFCIYGTAGYDRLCI